MRRICCVCVTEDSALTTVLGEFQSVDEAQEFIAKRATDAGDKDEQLAVLMGELMAVEIDHSPRVLIRASVKRGRPPKARAAAAAAMVPITVKVKRGRRGPRATTNGAQA